LAALTDGADRDAALRDYEHAVWRSIDEGELDAPLLEGLRKAAHWRGDLERASAIAAAEAAIEPGAPTIEGATDLSHVSMASVWQRDAETAVDEVVRRAGPALPSPKIRGKKLGAADPVYHELEHLCERFGARFGSVVASEQSPRVAAHAGRNGEVHWLVPQSSRDGLDAFGRFASGRLAWAVPRGAGPFLDDTPEKVAGTLAAILRASRCPIDEGAPVLPAVAVKLRRATRKSVQEAVGDTSLPPSALLLAASRLHRSADRAGLLACGDIAAAFATLSGGQASMTTLRASQRNLDLLHFWAAADSPLWGNDA
jgi:hypothetical protein